MRTSVLLLIALLAVLISSTSSAKGVYLSEAEFLEQVFGKQPVCGQTLWLSGETKQQLQKIFGRKAVGLRQRYWRNDGKTAWILNEIGKELPITIGVVVVNNQIERVIVMEYRESRGAEIRHPFFIRQFVGVSIKTNLKLNKTIDGITGATLSVRSMKRVAAAALFMYSHVVETVPLPISEDRCR